LSEYESGRRSAVEKAAREIEDGYIVGLGSGTTIAQGLEEIRKVLKERNLEVVFIPSSHQIELAAISQGLRLGSFTEFPEVDLAIDGADQVDSRLNLIKGGGAALAREKVIDAAAKRLVIVVDERKLVGKLGEGHLVPVEVLSFAWKAVSNRILKMGGTPTLREGGGKVGPVVTDNGNFVIDVDFGPINDPSRLEHQLKSTYGVVETGLFIDMAHTVYVGKRDGSVQVLERKPA